VHGSGTARKPETEEDREISPAITQASDAVRGCWGLWEGLQEMALFKTVSDFGGTCRGEERFCSFFPPPREQYGRDFHVCVSDIRIIDGRLTAAKHQPTEVFVTTAESGHAWGTSVGRGTEKVGKRPACRESLMLAWGCWVGVRGGSYLSLFINLIRGLSSYPRLGTRYSVDG
jgi:hypothetical protein